MRTGLRVGEPCVYAFARFRAAECFLARVAFDAGCGPALLAGCARNETFVFSEPNDAKLAIPLKVVPVDWL